jgi:DNA replication protein DnaC
MNTVINNVFAERDRTLQLGLEEYIEKNSNVECLVCRSPVIIEKCENASQGYNFFNSANFPVVRPAMVKILIHEACEKIASTEALQKNLAEATADLKMKKEICYENFVSKLPYPDPQGVELKNIFSSPEMAESLDLIKNWEVTDNFGFLFFGSAGTGKSYIAVALAKRIARKLIHASTIEDFSQNTASSLSLPVYINSNTLFEEAIKNSYAIPASYIRCSHLFVDDLGSENVTDMKRELLFNLLNERTILNLPTFVTTNLSLNDIRSRFYERILSRLLGLCVPIEITGEDHRVKHSLERLNVLKARGSALGGNGR